MRLDISSLREILHYNPFTGHFTWLVDTGGYTKAGHRAGSVGTGGYRRIVVGKKRYLEHRLAFELMGADVPDCIDHINQDKTNNAWHNLRPLSTGANSINSKLYSHNKSGFRGVSFKASKGKWYAYFKHMGKQIFCGYYPTAEEAAKASAAKRSEIYGGELHEQN